MVDPRQDGAMQGERKKKASPSHPLSPAILSSPQVDREEQQEEEEEGEGGREGGVEQQFCNQRRDVPIGDGGPCSSISQRARPASGERLNEARAV